MNNRERADTEPLENRENESEGVQEEKLPTFIISEENFGIEVRYVTEIVGVHSITDVEVPNSIKGVINLRGKAIPVRDVRSQFGVKERSYNDRTCIVVINMNDQPVGLIVDRILEVQDAPKREIEPSREIGRGNSKGKRKGRGKVERLHP